MNRSGALLAFFVMLAAAAPVVDAKQGKYHLPDFMAMSTDVIVGTVTSTESRWTNNNTQIVTDVTIEVQQAVKGDQNRGGSIHFQLPVGRVGAIVRDSPDLPKFANGEEVLLFLSKQPKRGFAVVGGNGGKFTIKSHPRTGEKYLFADSQAGHINLELEANAMANETLEEDATDPAPASMKVSFERRSLVKLDDFIKHMERLEERRNALSPIASDRP